MRNLEARCVANALHSLELRRAESVSLRLASTVDSMCRSLLPAAVPAVTVALVLHPTFGPDSRSSPTQV